jgi:hypothetical protein
MICPKPVLLIRIRMFLDLPDLVDPSLFVRIFRH